MKRLPVVLMLTFASIACFAQAKKSTAEVNQYNGVYVFFDCKPVLEYEHVATFKKAFVINSTSELISKAAAYVRKEYPTAEAVIIRNSQSMSKDEFEVIKFKQ